MKLNALCTIAFDTLVHFRCTNRRVDMKYVWMPAVGISALMLGGCTTVYEGKYNFSDGWREAQVVQIASASEIEKSQFSDCRENSLPQQLSVDKFIVLSYKHMNRPRKRVIPFEPSEGVRPGDLVYMNVGSCDIPLAPRGKSS